MDKIEIKKGVFEFEVGQEEVVGEIYINGKSLIEILRHEELPYLHPGESESVAGSYSFLRAGFVMMILTEGDGYGTTILDCPCGTYGCFNLDIKIEETDDRVYWYDFYQGFRPWYLYDNIAYFEFDKAQYYLSLIHI